MREEDEIRAAVVALAEAAQRGEDVTDALPHGSGTRGRGDAESAGGAEGEEAPLSPEETLAEALRAVFDAVRRATRASRLSRPCEWEAAGLVPPSMTAEDLEMAVYDRLRAAQEARAGGEGASGDAATEQGAAVRPAEGAAAGARPVNRHVRSAFSSSNGRAVGAPAFKRRREEPEPAAASESAPTPEPAAASESAPAPDLESAAAPAPERTPAPACALEPAAASDPASAPDPFADCRDIRLLMGAASYYLYDGSAMTDAYARWAFLAAEDDPVATFLACVREESSVYPRPMARATLANEPFRLDGAAVEAAFAAAREQGRADDIERIEASNGDVYFCSTASLSLRRARALAEWDAVERLRNV